jgi:large subunit ribosomal protein L13e
MKRNNALPSNHFKKTAIRVRTWHNQPARHARRNAARKEKAADMFPMPTDKLRPEVRCPTIRYNKKVRLGRGFTPEECVAAGVDFKYARTVGVAVDLRRNNRNLESFNKNVQRLREYFGKLTVFKSFKEAREACAVQHVGAIMPIVKSVPIVKTVSIEEVASFN